MDTKQEILDALHDATNLDNEQVDTEYFAQLLDNILPKPCDMGGVVQCALEDKIEQYETICAWFDNEYKLCNDQDVIDEWDKLGIETNAQIKLLRHLLTCR